MGYWVSIWVAIILEEHIIFRRKIGFNWAIWNEKKKLPLGVAALVAFLVGWVGAILSMSQVWFIGPIAGLVGDHGADVSISRYTSSLIRMLKAMLRRWVSMWASRGPLSCIP